MLYLVSHWLILTICCRTLHADPIRGDACDMILPLPIEVDINVSSSENIRISDSSKSKFSRISLRSSDEEKWPSASSSGSFDGLQTRWLWETICHSIWLSSSFHLKRYLVNGWNPRLQYPTASHVDQRDYYCGGQWNTESLKTLFLCKKWMTIWRDTTNLSCVKKYFQKV